MSTHYGIEPPLRKKLAISEPYVSFSLLFIAHRRYSIGSEYVSLNSNTFPSDLHVLSELRPILIDLSDLSLCASLFWRSFEHSQSIHIAGPHPDSTEPTFGVMDFLVVADLYNTLGECERAVISG
jgi:hypothetical protein